MQKRVGWIAALAATALLAGAATGQEARGLYLSYGSDIQSPARPGKPGVKLSIELVRGGKTLMVPPEHTFLSGDRIRLHFETNFDGHVGILGKGSSGRVTQHFPYPGASSVITRGGVKLMPARGDWLEFDDQPGEEQLAIILSRKPIAGLTSTGAGAAPSGSAGSTGGAASTEEEEEILAALNSRALSAGRDLFLKQSSGDSGYAVSAQEAALDRPLGLLVRLIHRGTTGDRALVVGISTYDYAGVPPTPGGRADAEGMARLARDRFGFPAGSVRRLLDSEATAEAIVRAFREWLIDGTEPGDRVFFHYAGHGSQLPDQDGDEHLDGADETLAPYDVDPRTGANMIRDDQLLELIAGLAGRRVVLVFDSCHSGTITRGPAGAGAGARYLPPPARWRQLEAAKTRGSAAPRVEPPASRDLVRMSFVDSADLERIAGTVVVSASAPDQLAFPIKLGDQYRGALSYLFERHHQGALPTVRQLREQLRSGVASMQRQGQLAGHQVPEIEFLGVLSFEDQPLFGDWEQAAAVALTNPLSSNRVRLQTVGRRSSYRGGERLAFEIETDVPGHLYVLVFSQGDRETGCSDCRTANVLFPAHDDPDNRITAGPLIFPRGEEGFEVSRPYGRDLMVALVSSAPLALTAELGDRTWSEIFQLLGLDELQEGVLQAVRQHRGIGRRPADGTPEKISWQGATWVVESHP